MGYNKYGNKKTVVDNITFDSKKEAYRYCELKLMLKAKEITELEMQPTFELIPTFKKNGKTHRSIKYIADFKYLDDKGNTIIEDVKSSASFQTEKYKMKKKMFEYKYPELTIKEIYEVSGI